MDAIRIENVRKVFGGTVTALDGLDLEIGAGELFFLLGASGCGKMTLLRRIAGRHASQRNRPCPIICRQAKERKVFK